MGSPRRALDNECTQGGGTVWCRGGVDGRSSKSGAWITALKMSPRNMEATTLESVRWRALRVC
jgi:hypothetical protein